LAKYNDQQPLFASSKSNSSLNFNTPTKPRDFQKTERMLLKHREDISDFNLIVQKFAKGAQSALYELKKVRRTLENTKAAILARDTRRNRAIGGFRTRGIISSRNLQKMKRDKQNLSDLEAIDKRRKE
jgi:hypothetical protein